MDEDFNSDEEDTSDDEDDDEEFMSDRSVQPR